MSVLLHPPKRVTFEGDLSEDDRRRIEHALRGAVQRALETAAQGRDRRAQAELDAYAAELAEPLDRTRVDARGLYLVPSYEDEGKLLGAKLLSELPEAAPGLQVIDGPSPLEGGLIVKLPGLRYIKLSSPRYVSAGTLSEAFIVGEAVFGRTSFAILQGPFGSPKMRYLAIGTDRALNASDMGDVLPETTESGEPAVPAEIRGKTRIVTGEWIMGRLVGPGGDYLTRGFVTKDRAVHWQSVGAAALWFAQAKAEEQKGGQVEAEVVRVWVFDEIDNLVEQIEAGDDTELQHAAELLSRLGVEAFRLVDWEAKTRYLKVLLAAWTWQEEEVAVVAIFKSVGSDSELDAMLAELKKAGRFNQLFDDLDSEVYSLLTVIGAQFPRERGRLTLDELVRLFQSMGLIAKSMPDALARVYESPTGIVVPTELIDELYDAVMGFVRFGADLLESVETIFTEPDKIVEGIAGLVQLAAKVTLASWGYPPAQAEVATMLAGMGESVLNGVRGADRLGVGGKIVRRIKWRLVWEIASFFVGVGEIKAAIQAAGISEKLAGVLRFLAILARLGEAAEAEVEGIRLARLAAILKAERAAFTSVEQVAELLSQLPENDIRKLGGLLSKVEIKEGETLADLAARSPELHVAVEDAVAKTELLQSVASKAGGLSEEIVEAFHTLIGRDGVELAEAEKVVAAIPEGEGARFGATLKRIPLRRVAAEARGALLELVASSPTRMDAVAKLGFDTFGAVYRRVAGKAEALDQHLAALADIERRLAGEGKAAEFRRLLDRLERDDPSAWLEVENVRRLRAGERTIGEWAELLRGSPKAQSALDKLLRRPGGDRMVDSLIDHLAGDRGLISDPEVVLALEKIDELSAREMDGLLELKKYMDSGGRFPQWDELLFTEPRRRQDLLEIIADLRDPANPNNLVVRSGMDDAISAALYHRNVEGGLGHFEAARSLLKDFPGARLEFEVIHITDVRRDIDIVMEIAGRRVDVEVKGYQATTGLSHVRPQIAKDLVRHLGDPGGPWSDLMWRFADPAYASNFASVERAFLEELEKLSAEGKLTMPLADAQKALRARFSVGPPWRLVDVLR